jgi:hypothetical protein
VVREGGFEPLVRVVFCVCCSSSPYALAEPPNELNAEQSIHHDGVKRRDG